MNDPPVTPEEGHDYQRQLREINEALLISSVHQHELTEELRRAREHLEARVAERTHELAQANEALRMEVAERKQSELVREHLLRQLVNAQENEQRRISRELHDQFGQQLTALRVRLSALKTKSDVLASIGAEIETLESITKQLDDDVDSLVSNLRPPALDDFGLVEALSDYVANWSKHFGIKAQMNTIGMRAERLPGVIETVLYRVTQETLNNVVKHAHAGRVNLTLEQQSKCVSLVIEDNGIGFDPEVTTTAKGLGLIGMQERVALASGTLTVESRPGEGATLFIRIPID